MHFRHLMFSYWRKWQTLTKISAVYGNSSRDESTAHTCSVMITSANFDLENREGLQSFMRTKLKCWLKKNRPHNTDHCRDNPHTPHIPNIPHIRHISHFPHTAHISHTPHIFYTFRAFHILHTFHIIHIYSTYSTYFIYSTPIIWEL